MTLTECKRAIEEIGLQPTKSLGQNFLIDGNILRISIETAAVERGETVVEIGPGMGILTEALLERGAHVVAIEKDARLVAFLQQRFARRKNLTLIHGDALAVSLDTALGRVPARGDRDASAPAEEGGLGARSYKVIANLPYSVSTAILRQFVDSQSPPRKMVLMLQREVGERLAAKPGSKEYSLMTVFTQAKYRVSLRHVVSRTCFYPVPEVDSAIVVLDYQPHPGLGTADHEIFARIVHAGFAQRRKQFAKMLRGAGFGTEQVEKAFDGLQFEPRVRAEALSVEQFVALARELRARR